MSGRDKFPGSLSRGSLLLLSLCVLILALHFIAEDLAAVDGHPGLDLPIQAEFHEHSEDQFVHPVLTSNPGPFSSLRLLPPALSGAFTFSPAPQLPPPNR